MRERGNGENGGEDERRVVHGQHRAASPTSRLLMFWVEETAVMGLSASLAIAEYAMIESV